MKEWIRQLFPYSNSIRHSACVMSSEYVTRTSLYLDGLRIFEWMKFLRRHLHQIQGNWAGRNFLSASRVNSWLIAHARMQRWIEVYKYQRIQLLNNKFIYGILGVRFTWIDCNNTIYVVGLFLVHRLWRNKLTRLLVSMIKMIGINCPTLVVSNKSRTWRAFRFVNFRQLTFFPLPFRSLMLH